MMSMPSSAAKTQFEIEHATVGSIVCDQAPTRRRPARGHVRRTGQAIVAVFTHKPPSAEVLDRLDLLDHPNLVEWLGTCDIDNAVIAISALAEGGSLLDRDAQLHLDEPEIARVILSVAAALDTLAEHGLSHGDVSPSNIVLDADGRILLGDLHDCVVADGAPLDRATPGFEGISCRATARNDASALGQVVDYLAHGATTWAAASLREAVELLASGDPLTETVKAELHGVAASRIEIVGPSGTSGTHVDMITQRFGRRPDRTTPPTSSPNARRVLIAAAVLCAAVTGAVLWSEQPPVCDGIGCNGEQAR